MFKTMYTTVPDNNTAINIWPSYTIKLLQQRTMVKKVIFQLQDTVENRKKCFGKVYIRVVHKLNKI